MTKKNGKLPIAMAALLALIAGGGHADPLWNTNSPQSDVTQGKFESNADYFMSVRNYAKMDFDKWWSVVAFKGEGSNYSSELAQVGLAARFGGLYTGLSYRGNGFRYFGTTGNALDGFGINAYTERTIDGKTWKVFNNEIDLNGRYEMRNEFSVLLGLADMMGFRLYYSTNYELNDQTDYARTSRDTDTGAVVYSYFKSWREELGNLNPGITWGMARELIDGRGIKPQVNIDLDFHRDSLAKEEFADPNNPSGETRGTEMSRGNSRFVPGIDVGLGGFTLARVNNFNVEVDLDYGIKLHLYENEYSYTDAAGKLQTKTLKGGRLNNATQFVDVNRTQHSLTPSISAGWSGDRLGLACKFGVPMTADIRNETIKSIKKDSTGEPDPDGSLVKDGTDAAITEYTLRPAIDLAMQWAIIPSMLFLNAGGKLAAFQATFTTSDRTEYNNDVEVVNSERAGKFINNQFVAARTTLYLGVTLFLKDVELQAAMGVDSNNNINVFSNSVGVTGSGGAFNFFNVLASLKF